MELLTKGEVTVTFKSQHGVVSEFKVQNDFYPDWDEGTTTLEAGNSWGSFSKGDIITFAGGSGTFQIVGGAIGHTLQIVKSHFFDTHFADAFKTIQLKHVMHDVYGYGEGSRAERRAQKFARRTRTDGWNKHGKGLERGKQYYKGQKAGHY